MAPGTAAAIRAAARLNAGAIRDKLAGRYFAAQLRYRCALALIEAVAPDDSDAIATIHHNLGGLGHARGEYERGEVLARRGLEIRLRRPADPGAVAADLIALAALVQGQGRLDESERLYRAGLALLRMLSSPDRFDLAVALGGLGVQYSERGRHRAAIRLLECAASLKASILPRDHPSLKLGLANLAAARRRAAAAVS